MEHKKVWMWIDWLIFSLRCGWYGTGLIYYYVYRDKLGDLTYIEFALFASIGFFIPLIFWNPKYTNPTRYVVTELLISGGFSILINNILNINLSTSVILMTVLMSGYLLTKDMARWAIPFFIILLPANRYWTIGSMFSFFLQYVDVLLFFGIGLGFNVITKSQKRYKKLLYENMKQYELIQQQNKALEHYASQVEKYALLEERNRMARDLHDSIGHHFTSITMGLDAISYMIKVDSKMAEEKIANLADVAREGLTEVRRTIHQIASSDEETPLLKQLETVVSGFGEYTNTMSSFKSAGQEPIIPPHKKLAVIRFVQECLTNAKRHGNATLIKVEVHFKEEFMQIIVENNGKKIDNLQFGFGLSSMKNRLEELNGSLEIKIHDIEGVRVICTLPIGGKHEKDQAITR
ncbi:sensor histidine kinase [Lysinibacillus sp. BW-2-10]|uniref:sensor histidine kinase n=1 Tax=Lysinibacillus sp. BW-2-10 TaxID=2590030 RepID=UPI00117C6541|nr:sensor histidine kinase [Lysinibacillus sp. BW-2-10]TSI11039.1 sensor histidine kinase [Lysinibacillus sp. BW-2-10]